MDRVGRKMKKRLVKLLLATFLAALVIYAIVFVVQHDRYTWTAWHGVAAALRDARTVTLVEYAGNKELARKTATPEEILRLRKAVSRWWYPFLGTGSLCYDSNHKIEIVRADGSELKCLISFRCETFLPIGETLPPASMPAHIREPLASFFGSVGMGPRLEVYRELEEYYAEAVMAANGVKAQGDEIGMLLKRIQETIVKVQTAPTLKRRRDAVEYLPFMILRIEDPWRIDEKTFNDLVSLMDSPDDVVRHDVAAAIGLLRERAKPAIPKLLEILPKVDCLDGVVTSADSIRMALVRIGVTPPPLPDCIRNAG